MKTAMEIINICLICLIVIVPTMFGIIGKRKEMGLIILAIALGLVFTNLGQVSEFTGAGFVVKVNTAVQKAYAAIEQLRELGVAVSAPIVDELAMSGQMLQYIPMKYKLERVAKIRETLRELGASEKQIEEVSSIIYQRVTKDRIWRVLYKLRDWNPEKKSLFEGLDRWDIYDWDRAKLDKFISDNDLKKNEETEESIRDLDYFLKNRKLRREDLWQS